MKLRYTISGKLEGGLRDELYLVERGGQPVSINEWLSRLPCQGKMITIIVESEGSPEKQEQDK